MSTCYSRGCKKFNDCARASINNEGAHTATDKANMKFIRVNNNGKEIEEYWCGEKGNYRLFEKVKKHGRKKQT